MANDDELKKTVDTFDATDAKPGQAQRQTPDNTPELKARAVQAIEPTGADRALHDKVRSGVAQAEQALGKDWDDDSERMTASLTLLARQSGFSERDQLSVGFNRPTAALQGGELAFVYRDGATASPDPYANRAHMTTSEAIARPAQETYQQLQAYTAQQQATQAQTQAQSAQVPTR
ncbi:XVIPCD domain-containing protein [Xanthomonas graminis]|uniref:XVIPCD domain-containing protein n=1 Tax=Xanthomonas graminis TaxID=3390026 RepID=UPI001F3EE3BA|nr:XVIPCD domain-containing protein [Xanthomonas translucens]UKE73443.1 hypothetical protein KFS85_00225 [Xanthomonas translucens pv. phleipratensis]